MVTSWPVMGSKKTKMHISLCRNAVSASSLPDVRARGLMFMMQDFTCSATDALSCLGPLSEPPELRANDVLLVIYFAECDIEKVSCLHTPSNHGPA